VALTAYDFFTAKNHGRGRRATESWWAISVGMAELGYENTLAGDDGRHDPHTKARRRAPRPAGPAWWRTLPFMSYGRAYVRRWENGGRPDSGGSREAVKVEGGESMIEQGNGRWWEQVFPVLGHIGLLPQSILETGGYKIPRTHAAVSGEGCLRGLPRRWKRAGGVRDGCRRYKSPAWRNR